MIAARNATKGRTTAMRFTVRSTLVMSWTLPTTPAANWRAGVSFTRRYLELRHNLCRNRAETRHRLAQLVVGDVRRGPETEVAPPAVRCHAGVRQRALQALGVRRFERDEAGDRIERRRAVAREDGIGEAERVDLRREQRDLVAVGGLEHCRRQPALGEELEHARGAVVARRGGACARALARPAARA